MPRLLTFPLCLALVLGLGLPAAAQIPGFSVSKQFRLERLGEGHWRATGQVEMQRDDQQFFADIVDYFTDTGRLVATGNVVFVSQDSRIAADRVEFNMTDRTGTFYNASGIASLGERADRSMFGTQEPDAYFYGETIEKLGPAKYRITKGGFTTCVQPTPRWELVASTATVTLEEYAMLKNTVLRVKGVPVLYLPVIYYPIQEDDRSTGFLIPSYGTSSVRGHTLSNAFFWAIDRSQDLTVLYDWFSRTGQGLGGEYRYVAGAGSEGMARTYWLNEHEATYVDDAGIAQTVPARRSYEIRANASQVLPARLRARGNVDYFSDVTVQQTYQNNFYDATRRQRLYGGNVTGSWGANSVSATYNINEVFYGTTDSTVYGGAPRITFSRAPRRVGDTPVYTSVSSQFNRIVRTNKFGDTEVDQGLGRWDVTPVVRVPFSRWPFLNLTGTVTWHGTYYTKSQDDGGAIIDDSLFRNYFDLRADVVGPVFNRIWDTPGNGYAEKYKHVIEPNLTIQRVTLIDVYEQIVKLESDDYTVGGTTRMSYGVTNRFLARRRGSGQAREFVNVNLSQTYYSDARAGRYDPAYSSSFSARAPSNFSPILLAVRANPTDRTSGALRLEYDYSRSTLLTVRASGAAAVGPWGDVAGGWSRRRYTTSTRVDNLLNVGTTLKAAQNRYGGSYALDYDFARDSFVQQRILGYYNAQCCGVAVEYQTYNFPFADPRFPVPKDRRFNISFTLAGVGTFSNFFGALGGGAGTSRTY